MPRHFSNHVPVVALLAGAISAMTITMTAHSPVARAPKVILISLDGAQPDLVKEYFRRGVLDSRIGLGRLKRHGVYADQNVTATPSVTAVSHIAIATGSTAVHNDISANTFHPVVAPISGSLSGFGAPIGGYRIQPLGPAPTPTAEPLWVQLRNVHVGSSPPRGREGTEPTSASTARLCKRRRRHARPITRCRPGRSAGLVPRASR